MTQLFDILKAFEADLKSKPGLPPVVEDNIPTDSASMRVKLTNPDEMNRYLDSPATEFTGEFNIQLSHRRGINKYTMLNMAAAVRDEYPRPTEFTANGYTVTVTQVTTSSIYQSDANEHITVLVKFMCIAQ